ncbi:hypothetical protein INT47_005533 [Mucor saturninus]|uniref:Uncharacterized protein n=1 Tax=Mucor saturninus TaxID=64648 RepID=A0A8H7V3X4_9FUNG|nr:hypothetical protein INT47_005533 [Mucor saturninus]
MIEDNLVWEEPNNYYTNTDHESEGVKRTSWCVDNKDDEQQLRLDLIDRATTHLRRRRLENDLQDVMSQVVSLQTQLESLRLDAITTIDTISHIFENDTASSSSSVKMNRQMDVLERRLSSHKSSLEQFTILQSQEDDLLLSNQHPLPQQKKDTSLSPPLTAIAMSRLSSLSLVSSIFNRTSECTSNTSVSDQQSIIDDDCISHIESISGEDHPFYDLAGKRSFREGSFCGSVYSGEQEEQKEPNMPIANTSEIRWRRRQRRQRHQQHLEQQQQQHQSRHGDGNYSDNESFISDDLLSLHKAVHPLSLSSPMTPPPNYHAGNFYFEEDNMDYHDKTHSWLYATQPHDEEVMATTTSLYPQRNVLDEAMSFLESISENGDDMGFGEDFYLLLRNPDLCCRPLSEIQSTMQELRQQTYMNQWLTMGKSMVYQTTCTSLQWCKFLSVLSAAVVISIMKGPEDVRRHSF